MLGVDLLKDDVQLGELIQNDYSICWIVPRNQGAWALDHSSWFVSFVHCGDSALDSKW